MNLDKSIRISLSILSNRYKITILEITVAQDKKINKNFKIICQNTKSKKVIRESFKNKRDLVRWLMCLVQK